jgi:hypothetical protein
MRGIATDPPWLRSCARASQLPSGSTDAPPSVTPAVLSGAGDESRKIDTFFSPVLGEKTLRHERRRD